MTKPRESQYWGDRVPTWAALLFWVVVVIGLGIIGSYGGDEEPSRNPDVPYCDSTNLEYCDSYGDYYNDVEQEYWP